MALSKIQSESINLADTYAFTGTVSGTVSGTNAFSARITAEEWGYVDGSATSLVQFNNDSTGDSFDTDSCYSTSSYKFTAPANGVFIFWYSIYTANGDTTNGFTFLKNSAKINLVTSGNKHFTTWQGSNDDHAQTATAIVTLSSGDTMAVVGTSSSDYFKGYCSWGGCRLA